MMEFAYNNVTNANTGHTFFKLYCSYYPCNFFEDEVDFCLKSYSTNKLAKTLEESILIYQQKLLHAQKSHKQAYDEEHKVLQLHTRQEYLALWQIH